jgi:hypothetical protein
MIRPRIVTVGNALFRGMTTSESLLATTATSPKQFDRQVAERVFHIVFVF